MTQDPLDLLGRSPLWANKPVIDRLVNRYGLEDIPGASNAVLIPRVVVPVTQADELLREVDLIIAAEISGGGVSFFTFPELVVPNGKRWRPIAFYVYRAGGDGEFEELAYQTPIGTRITMQSWTAASAHGDTMEDSSTWLPQGWSVDFFLSTWTSGNIGAKLLVEVEDAFRS